MSPGSRTAGILVVDDNQDSREMLAELLMHRGHHSIMATNGRDALRKLEYVLPDLIITDLAMPEMDGVELLRALAGDPRFEAIPAIVLTSFDEERAAAALGDMRARAILAPKPIRLGAFLDLVDRCLAAPRKA